MEQEVLKYVEDAIAFVSANGVIMGVQSSNSSSSSVSMPSGLFQHAPVTMLPCKLKRSEYEKAWALAKVYNKLLANAAQDKQFIYSTLEETCLGDLFTARLVALSRHVDLLRGYLTQHTHLGIIRSDYMIDKPNEEHPESVKLLQVELNTIAASFGCLSSRVSSFHKFMMGRHYLNSREIRRFYGVEDYVLGNWADRNLPDNLAEKNIPAAIAAGVDHYWEMRGTVKPINPLVLFVVQPNERNSPDQRWLEYELWNTYGIRVVRKSLGQLVDDGLNLYNVDIPGESTQARVLLLQPAQIEVANAASFLGNTNAVVNQFINSPPGQRLGPLGGGFGMDHQQQPVKKKRRGRPSLRESYDPLKVAEVAVVYFRAGYSPKDYPTDREWYARQLIEESYAIKCPSIVLHLLGTKKIQQQFAYPGVVEKFLTSVDSATVRDSFAGLWSLGRSQGNDDAAYEERSKAISNPFAYVVKPQREGGGYNYYGVNVAKILTESSDEELSAHILMQRIFPQSSPSVLLKDAQLTHANCVSELGIYANVLFTTDKNVLQTVIMNTPAGCLVRTKIEGVDEGGVAAGYSYLDSPFLID